MLRFSSIISSLRTHRCLFIGVLVTSFLQSFTLTIGALDINYDLITDKDIPVYAYDTNLLNFLFLIIVRIVPLVIIQSIFALFYCIFRKPKHKKIVAAILWLFPALIFPPASLFYLFTPLASIGITTDILTGSLSREDIGDGWLFISAFGFFCLFWLSVLIKNFIFNDEQI